MKAKALFIGGGSVLVAALTIVALQLRHYYRYDGRSVSLMSNPNACWNGLAPGPCLEFKVPLFRDARVWRPTPEQVRAALKDSNRSEEEEEAKILRACASYNEQQKKGSEAKH